MNNNVVEKTLKSIDNIDRLSDLAAISIYNTSHEAIDKFDVMQEHATPEYVEGEFVQESLLTGVLIGAGIIGVAISAFLIIKKIIESKAKGDPNAAPNTPEGADLTKPEDIQKLFDKWKTEYFNKYPDLVVENVNHADARQMSEYATLMTASVNQFTDRVNVAIDEYMDNGSEEKFIENIDIAALIGGADISAVLSSEGRIDQSTIGNLEVSAIAIAKSFKEFDGIIKNNIANFEKKAKEKNDKGTEEEGANSRVSEKTIKQFSDILKKKAEETGKIMVSFRKNVLGGFEAAIKAAANEKASSQTKQQTGNGGNGLTDEDKQRILNIMKVYYPEAEKQIIDEINVFDAAESAEELKEMLDDSYEELNPGKGAKNAFIRIAGVAEQVAAHKHFDWPIRASDYDLDRLDSEDTDTEVDNADGSGEGELKNQNTDDASAETEKSEKHEETTETPETENSNSEGTSSFDDTQVTPEKIEKVVSTIESLDPDITLTEKDRKYIDWFLSANNKDSGISDIIDILEKRYKELLNSNESGKLSTFNKYLLMATTSADINSLNAEEINAAFPQNRLDLLATKSEDMETPSAEEPKSSETEKSNNNQATALNNNDILKTVADKYFSGDVDVTKDTLEAFNGMPTTNIIRDCIRGGLNEYLTSGSGSLKETIQKYYDYYNEIFKDANLDIHLPAVPDFSDELVSKIKHIWNVKGGMIPSTDFDRMIDAMLHNSEEPLNQINESQLKMGSSEESSIKPNETSNTKLFTDEEEDKIVDAAYAVTGLDRKFRQEIYNAVTDDGFAEAAKKLYDKYADDANKLKQINEMLIAMAKSIGKESEVPALPTTEATPTESETSAENQTPEQTETPSEVPTTEPQSPSYTAPGVVTDDEELKKIADDLGLPLGNFIAAYDKVKEGNADYTESQMLTTVFNNQIAFNQFTLPAINEAIAKEYDKCKQVADAVHAPFDVEPITIDEATFEKLHAYFDQKNKSVQNMETAKLIPGALADMVMHEMRSSEIISPEDAAEKNITTPAFEKTTSNHVTPSDSPSNSSTGSRAGSNRQPTARPTATKQGAKPKQQSVRKPVNKSGSKQQPTKKPKQGLFGKFFGI